VFAWLKRLFGLSPSAPETLGPLGLATGEAVLVTPSGISPFDGAGRVRTSLEVSAGTAAVAFATLGKTVGTTAAKLSATSLPAPRGFGLKAAAGNTGVVYAGAAATVTAGTADATDGYPLAAGQEVFFPVDDLTKVWLVATAAAQKVFALVA
jgi:hypothetical protein